MPNLRQLEYLVAIADTHHFRKAAEKTNTTQPTLSGQLKALEHRLGVQLVERTRTRVVLTPVGAQVVAIARRMLRDAHEIRDLAQSRRGGLAGVMRLGLPPTIGPYLLPRLIPTLRKSYPQLKLYVREELPQQLPQALAEGRLDLIIAPLPIRADDVHTVTLFTEPLSVAVAADHPLAEATRIEWSQLKDQEVLALGPGHQLHDLVATLCEESGARLRFDYEGTSLDTLREMVAMGLGITFLPGLYVNSMLTRDRTIKILQISGRPLTRTIAIAWRKTSARHDNFMRLAQLLRDATTAQLPLLKPLEKAT